MSTENSCSHKGEKRRLFTLEFKKQVAEQEIRSSYREAARTYNVDKRGVHKWCTKIDVLAGVAKRQCGKKMKRLDGGSRKLANVDHILEQICYVSLEI